MFRLIKQVFLGLLTFCGSLATNCMSLSNEQYMFSPTPIDLKECSS